MAQAPAVHRQGPILPTTRKIEEILREAQVDPRLASIIIGLAERQRVQHQQMYGVAQLMSGLMDKFEVVLNKIGIRDKNLSRLGVEEMLKTGRAAAGDGKDALVNSVEEFDSQPIGGEAGESRKKN